MLARYDFSQLGKNPAATARWIPHFLEWLKNLTIDSKETGVGPLNLYQSQKLVLEQIGIGMQQDIRHFSILKARQLGLSTLTLAIDLFWLSVFPGTQGALVVDEESNRDNFRQIIERYWLSLPRKMRPRKRIHNRNMLSLANGSVLYYLIAGTKKKGSFGQGKGMSFVHATELSRYGDEEAWASFVSGLAEQNPNRLFIYESTARGPNMWEDLWNEAIESTEKMAIFLGWWTKETYRIERGSRQYKAEMLAPYSEEEKEKIGKVKALYGVDIDDEQVAWYRAKSKELMSGEQGFIEQESPWYAEEAFRNTGKLFFPHKNVSALLNRAHRLEFTGYRYHMRNTFDTLESEKLLFRAGNDADLKRAIKESELRVWEEPSAFGTYSVGADPAYGDSIEENLQRDRFAITVLRGYADRVVQVAEYAADNISPDRFAWIIAHLCGWYRNTRLVLEINGPGAAVFTELQHVQRELRMGHRAAIAREKGIHDTFAHMSHYLYHRPDSLGAGYAYHFKSTSDSKATLLQRARGAMLLNSADLRSVPMLQEMGKIVQVGGWIGAEGRKKDDRTFAYALAYRGYDDWLRAPLSAAKATYREVKKREQAAKDIGKGTTFASSIMVDYFRRKEIERAAPNPAGEWKFAIKDKVRPM